MAKNGAYAAAGTHTGAEPWIKADCWIASAALGDERMLLAKVLDRAAQAEERNIPAATDFLSPAAAGAGGGSAASGRRDGRRRVSDWGAMTARSATSSSFFRTGWSPADAPAQSPIRCLRARFRAEEQPDPPGFSGQPHGHGHCAGKGGGHSGRRRTARICWCWTPWRTFCCKAGITAGRAHLRVEEIDPGASPHSGDRTGRSVRDTVSSLRLDAVCVHGLPHEPGDKAAELIEGGRVQLNWRVCEKADKPVAEGDTVSARGFGKLEVTEVGGLTKKGRIPITVRCCR